MKLVSPTTALVVALAVLHFAAPPRSSVGEAASPDTRTPAGQCPTGVVHHHHCVCKAEGQGATASDQCCSGALNPDTALCCGDMLYSCLNSDCCGSGVCILPESICVLCLTDGGAPRTDESDCCSSVTGEQGTCCGEPGFPCAESKCCGGDQLCYQDLCVACLPDGASTDTPPECCSGKTENEKCCGTLGGSCVESECCADGYVCHQGTCGDCLAEGTSTVDGDLCCSSLAVDNVCCGENRDTCANSLCCANGGICADGACIPCFDAGDETPSADACCSHLEANGRCCLAPGELCVLDNCCPGFFCGADSTCTQCRSTGAHCTDTSECCTGECCNGTCREEFNDKSNCGSCGNACTSFEQCQGGQCGQMCTDSTTCAPGIPPAPDVFCPEPTPYCTGFCSFDKRYLVCCGEVPGHPGTFGTTCGDGTCCYGTCDFQNRVCLP